MRIVADNTIPFLKGVIEPTVEVEYLTSNDFTAKNIAGADALIVRSIDKCTQELLEGSQVKLITTATIGFDHIDTRFCDSAGIKWKNAPGCNAVSVAQYVLASLVSTAIRKKIPLTGKTIGIIGVGFVGKEVEKVCLAFGMKVLKNDPLRAEIEGDSKFVSLNTIAEEADIITFHTPLTKEGRFPTHHLANELFLMELKKKPWFINASRGSVHDTNALLKAKKQDKISEIIIDCWENEPNICRDLLDASSIGTPHIAGFSADGKANATRMCLEEIEKEFHLKFDLMDKINPNPPVNPTIDLNIFSENRLENAILTSFNPSIVDKALRNTPEQFEQLRSNYNNPREFKAYKVINASDSERYILNKLGFN